jgi:hypothetical protein
MGSVDTIDWTHWTGVNLMKKTYEKPALAKAGALPQATALEFCNTSYGFEEICDKFEKDDKD